MKNIKGTQRVIIKNVRPQVENGQFPAKRALGEKLTVTADIFSDGHDVVIAELLITPPSSRKTEIVPLKLLVNDHWEGSFIPDTLGFYEYTLRGWVDHFATWQRGLRKKFEANQRLHVDLLIGAEIIEKTAAQAKPSQAKKLKSWAQQLKESKDDASGVSLALSEEVTTVMDECYDRTHATPYAKTLKLEVERKKALFSSWYEFFPRSASPIPGKHGTFKDCIRLLPRIAEMGFDVLYFPPIHPIGRINRKGLNNALKANPGDPGSCWAIGSEEGGHKAIHPELGTLKDFTHLLKAAESYDIEIALDIAFQCAPDHPYVKEHPQWFRWRPDGSVQYAENPPKKYEDILPINFETDDWQNLWQELKSVIEYWIDKGVKIFRVDNPHTKSFGFWEWMIKEVRTQHPEVIFLAEAFTRPRVMEWLAKTGFNQSYTYFTWRHSPHEMREYMLELSRTDMRDYYRPNFWPNTPDILTPDLVHGGEAAHIFRFILAATLSSNYGLYGPVYEFGINTPYPGKEEYLDSEKYEIKHWDWNAHTRIREIITRVNKVRKENPALQQTFDVHFADSSNPAILCYAKADEERKNVLIIAVNMDPYHTQSASVRIPIWELNILHGSSYVVHDLLSGSKFRWHDEWNYVEMNPYLMPAHIFKVEKEE